jgi:hypothetical protein
LPARTGNSRAGSALRRASLKAGDKSSTVSTATPSGTLAGDPSRQATASAKRAAGTCAATAVPSRSTTTPTRRSRSSTVRCSNSQSARSKTIVALDDGPWLAAATSVTPAAASCRRSLSKADKPQSDTAQSPTTRAATVPVPAFSSMPSFFPARTICVRHDADTYRASQSH